MNRRFKIPYAVPPSRKFFYQIPGGPYVETSCDWAAIEQEVRRRCADSGLEAPEPLRECIEDYMCDHLPDGFCTGRATKPMVTYSAVLEGTDKIVKTAAKSGDFGHILADKVDSRAAACLSCPAHSMGLCLTCNGLLAHFERWLAGRATEYDRTLRVCTATRAAIPLLLHVGETAMPVAEYPDGCWVLKERGHVT